MAGSVHNPDMRTEFWRPAEASRSHFEAVECSQCGSEFAVGARYCHVCGADRTPGARPKLQLLRQLKARLHWNSVEQFLGLNRAAAIAFCLGILFVFAALLVGLIYQAQSTLDWEAIQMWRIEWLLAALVAFGAGILLRRQVRE
jgi:hypothetical protein